MNLNKYLSKAKGVALGVLLSGAAFAGDKDPAPKFIKEGVWRGVFKVSEAQVPFNFPLQKVPSLSRRTDANCRCSHSRAALHVPRATQCSSSQSRDISSPAIFTTTKLLSRFTCKPSHGLITCRVNHVDLILISAQCNRHLTASTRIPFFTHT